MKQYSVTGMSCAACSARVEKAVSAVEGVDSCAVNLLTGSMNVEGCALPETVISAVVEVGYGASLKQGSTSEGKTEKGSIKDTETPLLKKRLWVSVGFLAVLMYLSMGHTMWNMPLPSVMAHNPMIIGLCQMLLAGAVMIINQKFFINGNLQFAVIY